MIRILLLFVAMGIAPIASAQTDEPLNLDALYQQIDEAIRQSPQYVAERKQEIAICRDSLRVEMDAEKQISLAEKLFHLYIPYRNDSALHYAELCISLADSIHRRDLSGRFRSMMALRCSSTDRPTESLELLRSVDKSALDDAGLIEYYNAWMHVCGELGSYTQRMDYRQKCYALQNLYRDSVLMVTKEGSEKWFHLKMDILSARKLYQDALELSNKWLENVSENTHEYAYASFYRSMIYDNLNNHDMACYWLGKSALNDIRCAVMDQASLLFLAERLADDGDISRAYRYMEFAKECNLAFCPRMRAYQVNPVIDIIEKSSQATQSKANLILIIASVVIGLLLIALIYVCIRIRRAKAILGQDAEKN